VAEEKVVKGLKESARVQKEVVRRQKETIEAEDDLVAADRELEQLNREKAMDWSSGEIEDIAAALKTLKALRQAFCKVMDARIAAMARGWMDQGYKLLVTRASRARSRSSCCCSGRRCLSRCCHCPEWGFDKLAGCRRGCTTGLRRMSDALWNFGWAELMRHKCELERMRQLIDGLFEMEVKESNLDEVSAWQSGSRASRETLLPRLTHRSLALLPAAVPLPLSLLAAPLACIRWSQIGICSTR
jgi:hypothetical protein